MVDIDFSKFLKQDFTPKWAHMVIITGKPGNRSDFVAGWLASAGSDKFLNLSWTLYPGWGKSVIDPIWSWAALPIGWKRPMLPQENISAIQSYLSEHIKEQIDTTAPIAITKCHVSSRALWNYIPEEYLDRFTFVDVEINDNQSDAQIEWEGFVKNILFAMSFEGSKKARQMLRYYVNNFSDDDDQTLERCYKITKDKIAIISHACQKDDDIVQTPINMGLDTIRCDYKNLMQPDGCQELIEHFNLPADYAKNLWQTCLPMAKSADRIWCRGRWWERPEY